MLLMRFQKKYTGIKVEVLLRGEDDYPNVVPDGNIITCKKDERTIIFTFRENKLATILDTNNYNKNININDYTNILLDKKTVINAMDTLDGVTAVLTEGDNGFVTSISIDYNLANYDNFNYKEDYYKKDTLPKVVNFELNAKGYTCN